MPPAILAEAPDNPIDEIERIASGRDWIFDRPTDLEMAAEIPGQWGDYGLYVTWSEELRAVHVSCALDLRVPDGRQGDVQVLLSLLNERLWLGHFALWRDEGLPMFRQTVQVGRLGIDREILEGLVEVAVAECERFYPAFQFVIWGGMAADEAVAAAMLDVAGEA